VTKSDKSDDLFTLNDEENPGDRKRSKRKRFSTSRPEKLRSSPHFEVKQIDKLKRQRTTMSTTGVAMTMPILTSMMRAPRAILSLKNRNLSRMTRALLIARFSLRQKRAVASPALAKSFPNRLPAIYLLPQKCLAFSLLT